MNYEDKTKLIKFVEEYDEIHLQMDVMQKAINNMVKNREALLDRVEDLKANEQIFINELVDKYGPTEVTPNKLLDIVSCRS